MNLKQLSNADLIAELANRLGTASQDHPTTVPGNPTVMPRAVKHSTTRIGLIREAIDMFGGNTDNLVHYADNVNGDGVYKVEKYSDGLSITERNQVIGYINQDPRVKKAYLSRPITSGFGRKDGGHIKVRFHGLAKRS